MCKTPIVGAGHHGRTLAAYLDSMGAEGYAEYAYGGLSKLDGFAPGEKSVSADQHAADHGHRRCGERPRLPARGSVRDFDDLKNKFGIGTAHGELQRAYRRTRQDPQDAAMAEVERLGDRLLKQAKAVHMDRELFKEQRAVLPDGPR